MLGVSELGALNYYTLFRLIPLTLFISRNPTLIYLPLSGFLDSLLCNPMAPTPDLVFFLLMSQTLVAALSFSSSRAYSFLSFLPPLFLRLAPTLIMQRSTSLLTTPPRSHFLMFMLPLFVFLRRIAEPISFLSPFFPPVWKRKRWIFRASASAEKVPLLPLPLPHPWFDHLMSRRPRPWLLSIQSPMPLSPTVQFRHITFHRSLPRPLALSSGHIYVSADSGWLVGYVKQCFRCA